MNSEYSSLLQNETWELVPPPEDTNIVGSRWMLKVKRDENGSIDLFEARLVAQGYSQTKGVDYDEVFSPVARYTSIRTLLALGNAHYLEIHQMDVKTAFLNCSFDCNIYMSQPQGFVDPDRPDYVCKLNKASMDSSSQLDVGMQLWVSIFNQLVIVKVIRMDAFTQKLSERQVVISILSY